MKNAKFRTYEILENVREADICSKIFEIFITTLIILNVFAVILETVESISMRYAYCFYIFELLSVVIFTLEYVLRIWSCTSDKKYKHPLLGRFRFAVTFLALVDLFAILPFYLPMIITFDLRFIRALRLFRLFRLLKIGRYSRSLKTLGNVLKEKKEELLITIFVLTILLVVSSCLVYYAEKDAQPDVFTSIPAAMWWGVTTLTTVSYGDVIPVTTMGKIIAAIICILGIGMFALPTGILGAGFVEEIRKSKEPIKTIICPHCGKDIHP